MNIRRWIPLLGIVIFTSACEPGGIFGPDMDMVTVRIAKLVSDDTFKVYVSGNIKKVKVDGVWMDARDVPGYEFLTDEEPVREYRVDIQTRDSRGRTLVEHGRISVNVESLRFGLSRTKSREAYEDRVAEFEFRKSDFPK